MKNNWELPKKREGQEIIPKPKIDSDYGVHVDTKNPQVIKALEHYGTLFPEKIRELEKNGDITFIPDENNDDADYIPIPVHPSREKIFPSKTHPSLWNSFVNREQTSDYERTSRNLKTRLPQKKKRDFRGVIKNFLDRFSEN